MKLSKVLAMALGLIMTNFAYAQPITIKLPPDAFLIKFIKSLDELTLPEVNAQGPALNGIIYIDSDEKTNLMYVKIYHQSRSVVADSLKVDGYIFARYLVPIKLLNNYFEYDESKIYHTAPDLRANFYRRVSNGQTVAGTETSTLAGVSAGQYLAYYHARAVRGASKPGFFEMLKMLSGKTTIDPLDYEKEMQKYWMKADPDELVLVDLVCDALPMNDSVILESIKVRVTGLVTEEYIPYTKARLRIQVLGLNVICDPVEGMPPLADFLKKQSAAFKSKGVLEKRFLDQLKLNLGAFIKTE